MHDLEAMTSLTFAHFPTALSTAHIALFTGITNAASLRARIIAASMMEGPQGNAEREAVNFAFVEASLVCCSEAITDLVT